jgi:tetratricopeptide (TPR) repeat protein
MQISKITAAAAVTMLFISCSSAPQKPAAEYAKRNQCTVQIALGNRQLASGSAGDALASFSEALRLAVSTDDAELRINAELGEGSALDALGKPDEADAVRAKALEEAEASGNRKSGAAVKIASARALAERGTDAQQALETALKYENDAGNDSSLRGSAFTAAGLSEKTLGDYKSAETYFLKAAGLYEKDNYLEDAAYSWYLAGSARSKAGNYDDAEAALQKALELDRRAENTAGLALIWKGIARIRSKAGNEAGAAAARSRSAEIYRAAGMNDKADKAAAADAE